MEWHIKCDPREISRYIFCPGDQKRAKKIADQFDTSHLVTESRGYTVYSGEYKGVLMYLAPQVDVNGYLLNTQALDLRGNGTGDVVGTIIAPSASVTMFGNSGSGYRSQVIGYNIDSGSVADITVNYNSSENWYLNLPPQVGLFQ